MSEMSLKRVLWTGGWDSTYVMLKLSKENIILEPIYCIDKYRPSLHIEMEAMDKMLPKIMELKTTKAKILPIRKIVMEDIPANERVTEAYNNIRKKIQIGSQYDWIARLAVVCEGLHIGIAKPNGEFDGCQAAVKQFGKFKKVPEGLAIDKNSSSSDLNLVFGNILFPIADTTELEMVQEINEWGEDHVNIMKLIWFCYTPIDGQPCGICRPCQQKMECGMEFLLPESGQIRYRKSKLLKPRLKSYLFSFLKSIFGESFANRARELYRKYFKFSKTSSFNTLK